jgi:hypothetical protein
VFGAQVLSCFEFSIIGNSGRRPNTYQASVVKRQTGTRHGGGATRREDEGETSAQMTGR